MRPLILIYSRDPEFYLIFSHILEADGFASELSDNGEQALRLAGDKRPNAIILDSQIDDEAAPGLCAQLKASTDLRGIPVVALIAAGAGTRHLDFLRTGADECFSRPFAPAKLLSYLRTALALQEIATDGDTELRHGRIRLNRQTYRVYCNGTEVHLPPIEFRLLKHLLEASGRVCSREELLQAAWQSQDGSADPRGVDTRIARLRRSLKNALNTDVIRTVRSAGYALTEPGTEPPRAAEA